MTPLELVSNWTIFWWLWTLRCGIDLVWYVYDELQR